VLLFWMSATLDGWGMNPDVLRLVRPYLDAVAWSALPLLLYFSFRRYLQGVGVVRPIMITLIAANVLNVLANWVLIYGHLGAPALGIAGSAWATVLARVVMVVSLGGVIVHRERQRRPGLMETPLVIEWARLRRLIALGAPAAGQLTLEVGVFAAGSALAGRMLPASLAAHQIALNLAGFTYMVPLGLASAGAVRVGHAIGRGDAPGAARAGWTALLFGVAFMSVASLTFIAIPRVLLGAFTTDPRVVELGVTLLAVAAVFQLFDGLQGVATGVLRGLGDTRTPMFWNLAGHWGIGLPLAYLLAFRFGFGVIGLWWGLSSGLIICGIALLGVWWRRIHAVPHLLSLRGGGLMPEESEAPRPHGDPLEQEIVEDNPAQTQSDAPGDVVATGGPRGLREESDRSGGKGSTANGIPAADEDDGAARRRAYDSGAELVSKID
jgi:MATE family multidrug resistance protein